MSLQSDEKNSLPEDSTTLTHEKRISTILDIKQATSLP